MIYKLINYKHFLVVLFIAIGFVACNRDHTANGANEKFITLKGLYSFGPEVKSFTQCEEGREFWVVDSANTLELAYANLGFEKPYVPVYIEVQAHLIKSDTTMNTGDYDSTMVVTKLLKITKDIPEGPCSQ
jgi:copper homeostasis protein (lipoprotein)